ncbi:MAG: serine/threonine-protein kinase [Myxococcota bacterium]
MDPEFPPRFRVDDVLLDDAAGRLYRAYDTKLGRAVSLKVLRGDLAPRSRKRFVREARILGGLSHPTLVPVYEVSLDSDPPYMVLGPVPGESLAERVERDGPAPWRLVVRWMRELLHCLGVAHARGFAHRDLRPEVVFLGAGEPSTTRLLGFGRLRIIGNRQSTSLEDRPDIPIYWAPELFLRADVDPRSDLRGVAAVGFFALTGRPPVLVDPRGSAAATLQRLINEEPPPVRSLAPDLPAELEAVLQKALSLKEEQRYQSVYEMLSALASVEGDTLPLVESERVEVEIGDVVDGTYRIKALLGRGGMSTVFLATDQRRNEDIALKCFHERGSSSHATLMDEAVALANIEHPHVVTMHGHGSYEGVPYLSMENVPGHSLRTILDRRASEERPIGVAEAISIFEQVASGLQAVHDAGFVHGDVKPGNIILGAGFQAKLIDFGLVRPLADPQPSGRFAGTPAYCAPEKVQGRIREEYAVRSDVYSLAVTLYELLTGRRPFEEGDVEHLLAAHLWATPPPLSSLSRTLGFLEAPVRRGMAKQPEDRFSSCDVFRQTILDLLDTRPFQGRSRVLLVDGDHGYAAMVIDALSLAFRGCEVVREVRGDRALARLEAEPFDAVWVELAAPAVNGLELAAHLRAMMPDPPALVCTVESAKEADTTLLAALGVNTVTERPRTAAEVRLLVRRLLESVEARP